MYVYTHVYTCIYTIWCAFCLTTTSTFSTMYVSESEHIKYVYTYQWEVLINAPRPFLIGSHLSSKTSHFKLILVLFRFSLKDFVVYPAHLLFMRFSLYSQQISIIFRYVICASLCISFIFNSLLFFISFFKFLLFLSFNLFYAVVIVRDGCFEMYA